MSRGCTYFFISAQPQIAPQSIRSFFSFFLVSNARERATQRGEIGLRREVTLVVRFVCTAILFHVGRLTIGLLLLRRFEDFWNVRIHN